MGSCSRPRKHAAAPPPLYLTVGEHVPYCQTCGRAIGSRNHQQKQSNAIKYYSDRCRHRKQGHLDRKIEDTIVSLLNAKIALGAEEAAANSRVVKGDRRTVVTCDDIERIVFDRTPVSKETLAGNTSRGILGWREETDQGVTEMRQGDELPEKLIDPESHSMVRMPESQYNENGDSVGVKKACNGQAEISEQHQRRLAGQRRADQREMVRRAARRGVVFGFLENAPNVGDREQRSEETSNRDKAGKDTDHLGLEVRRKCEAIMNGLVVEPSYAKGNWAIRWRE